jgi:hypothetical protein
MDTLKMDLIKAELYLSSSDVEDELSLCGRELKLRIPGHIYAVFSMFGAMFIMFCHVT